MRYEKQERNLKRSETMLKNLTGKDIDRLAEFGATLSRHCRNAWTGEQTRTALPIGKLTGGHGGVNECMALENLKMAGLEDIADLRQFRLVIPGSHKWQKRDWIREIKARL